MDDPKAKFVPLTPPVDPTPTRPAYEPPNPPDPKKVPAETRSPQEDEAERNVKTSKFRI